MKNTNIFSIEHFIHKQMVWWRDSIDQSMLNYSGGDRPVNPLTYTHVSSCISNFLEYFCYPDCQKGVLQKF